MSAVTIPQALEMARQHHSVGRLAEAEGIYRQILALQPENPDALHLLGLIAYQCGQPQIAVELIRRAIVTTPSIVNYHNNLGLALTALEGSTKPSRLVAPPFDSSRTAPRCITTWATH